MSTARERNTFTCAKCGGTFNKGWSDAEAMAEYHTRMPEVPPDEPTAVICDVCYERFMTWLAAHPEGRDDDG